MLLNSLDLFFVENAKIGLLHVNYTTQRMKQDSILSSKDTLNLVWMSMLNSLIQINVTSQAFTDQMNE